MLLTLKAMVTIKTTGIKFLDFSFESFKPLNSDLNKEVVFKKRLCIHLNFLMNTGAFRLKHLFLHAKYNVVLYYSEQR